MYSLSELEIDDVSFARLFSRRLASFFFFSGVEGVDVDSPLDVVVDCESSTSGSIAFFLLLSAVSGLLVGFTVDLSLSSEMSDGSLYTPGSKMSNVSSSVFDLYSLQVTSLLKIIRFVAGLYKR